MNSKADANLDVGEVEGLKRQVDGKSTPKAQSGENGGTKVTVAAAVAIAIVTAKSISAIADGLTLINPSGAAKLADHRGHRFRPRRRRRAR